MNVSTEIIRSALEKFRPAVVYLFGSVANDRARPESDLDIAFLPTSRCEPYDVFETAQELAGQVGREVDLVDLSRASAVMKAQVLKTGRRLFVNDEHRTAEFEMYALSDYARANEERREVLAAFGDPARAR
jgi:predicted nucleotidyltransferase